MLLVVALLVLSVHSVMAGGGQPWIPGSASQSSTNGYSTADRGIDGDEDTIASTRASYGLHWWKASMSNTVVGQIKMKAYAFNGRGLSGLDVSLYSGDSLVGTCDAHTGSQDWETLNCTTGSSGLAADRVELEHDAGSQYPAWIRVFEVEVVPSKKVSSGGGQPWTPGSASQSSTNGDSTADRGIDGDEDTIASTRASYGLHWWKASMSNTVVGQIKMKGYAFNGQGLSGLDVSLYSGDSLVGTCDAHTGSQDWETLNCTTGSSGLVADRVELEHDAGSQYPAWMRVFEIEVVPNVRI